MSHQMIRRALAPLCPIVFAGIAQAQPCINPAGATRINDSYAADAAGNWWLINNYQDNGPADGYINQNDTFNFVLSSGGGVISLADINFMKYTSAYGTWFYITGTSTTQNFRIYRTQDFKSFEYHTLAFDNLNQNGSNQFVTGPYMSLNGQLYANMWGGELFVDPLEAPGPNKKVYLAFSATKNTQDVQFGTCYVVSMAESDFLSWHSRTWSGDGPRFADTRLDATAKPRGYYYTADNSTTGAHIQDGGYSKGYNIPSSGPWDELNGPNCGQLEMQPRFGCQFRCQGSAPYAAVDVNVFFDPNLAATDPWKRVLFYAWTCGSSDTNQFDIWGNNIVAHPLMAGNLQVNSSYASIPVAKARNINNPVGSLYNGTEDDRGNQWAGGGVAEGPAVFYLESTKRYYMVFARNVWEATGYQLVYRMTDRGAPLSSIILPGWFTDDTAPEKVLLRANNYTQAGPASSGGGYANYGGANAFTLYPDTSGKNPTTYLAFHVKFDYDTTLGVPSYNRTCFFKELTVENYDTGELVQWKLGSDDPRADITRFRVPICPH
jgi:hypothetical protein